MVRPEPLEGNLWALVHVSARTRPAGHARISPCRALPNPCPLAAQVRFRFANGPLLDSCIRGGSCLDPTPLHRIRSHEVHSPDVMVTMFGALRHAETRRSSIRTR